MAGLQGHTYWADTATVFQTLHPHTIRFTYGFAQITLMHAVVFLSPGTPQIQVRCMFIWFFYLSSLVCFETTLSGNQYTDTVHTLNHFMQVCLSNDLYLHLIDWLIDFYPYCYICNTGLVQVYNTKFTVLSIWQLWYVVIITIIPIHVQKEKKKEFTNVKYIAICLSFEVGHESISVSSSMLHPSVIVWPRIYLTWHSQIYSML